MIPHHRGVEAYTRADVADIVHRELTLDTL